MAAIHPAEVLEETGAVHAPVWSPCEHYAGDRLKLEKATRLPGADRGLFDLTLDLEDGAEVGAEHANACELIEGLNLNHVSPSSFAGRVGFRVHPPDHRCFVEDLRLIANQSKRPIDYLVIPKVGGAESASEAIRATQRTYSLAQKPMPAIQFFIETHEALSDVAEIAKFPQVSFLTFGQMDLTSAHRGAIPASAMHSPGQFTNPLLRRAKLELSAACHAAGKIPTHNPTLNYNDIVQTAADAVQAREFGFLRMMSIHPSQIAPILEAFSPQYDELSEATEILLKAQQKSWGPIAYEGKLHDRASYRFYWDRLRLAKRMDRVLPQAAEIFFSSN